MERSHLTARELYETLKANPARARFGFGRKPALVNVALQNAYTQPQEFVPEECVADRHESPHFANLYDMALNTPTSCRLPR